MAKQQGFKAMKSMVLKEKGVDPAYAVEMPDAAGVEAAHQAKMRGAKNRRGGGGKHAAASQKLNEHLKNL